METSKLFISLIQFSLLSASIASHQDLKAAIKLLDDNPTGIELINELPLANLDGKSAVTGDETCYNGKCYPDMILRRDGKELVLVPPDSPEDINVTFHILESRNQITSFNYNTSSEELRRLPLHSCKRTIFLIHGWLDNVTVARFWWEPLLTMSQKYASRNFRHKLVTRNRLERTDFQVIFVDWSGGASSSFYLPAVSNSRVVSSEVSNLIQTLVDDHGFDAMDIHLIGFSLGAHISGFVGKQLSSRYKPGMITGLEPANALFEFSSRSGQLHKTDAHFVQVVHTSSGNALQGFSKSDPLGCIDYYVNGAGAVGLRGQPGCDYDMPLGAVGGFLSSIRPCVHDRAPRLFTHDFPDKDSYGDECQMVAYECNSHDDFVGGNCADCGPKGQECSLLGMKYELDMKTKNEMSDEDKRKMCLTNNKFFIQTSDKPYCLHHYQLVVETLSDMPTMTGQLLINTFNESIVMKREFEAGRRYTQLITTNKLIRDNVIKVEWRIDQSFLGSFFSLRTLNQFKIKRIHLNYMSNIDAEKRAKFSSIFCSQKYFQSLTHGTQILLEKCS